MYYVHAPVELYARYDTTFSIVVGAPTCTRPGTRVHVRTGGRRLLLLVPEHDVQVSPGQVINKYQVVARWLDCVA